MTLPHATHGEVAERIKAKLATYWPDQELTISLQADEWERIVNLLAAQTPVSETPRIDLSRYVNAASIGGADCPHEVVEKLQRAIDASTPSAIEPRHIAGRQREADARFLYKQAEEGDMIFKQTATYLADLVSKNTLVESK